MRSYDFSARGRPRVYLLTVLGTAICIAVAFAFDSYSIKTGTWRWGDAPLNNLLIPLILAPPFFHFLLSKLRELAIAHRELMTVASTDSLTSLLNRRAFTEMVDVYLEKVSSRGNETDGALLVIDVDHFKKINDRFGHDQGDDALKLISRTIRESVRDIDLVGRMGGEEFSVFLPGVDQVRSAAVAERIRAAIKAAQFAPDGKKCGLSVSVGGALFDRAATFSELYRFADQRLYAAKRAGRNRVEMRTFGCDPEAGAALH